MSDDIPSVLFHHHGNHNGTHKSGNYYARNEKLFWVIVSLFAVLPVLLILLSICRRISVYSESRRRRRARSSNISSIASERSSANSIYTITTKQDYMNLAPPRYSLISTYPLPTTYEKPPPYSSATR